MKLIPLNEQNLVEKEISGQNLKDVTLSPEVEELINQGLFQKAFEAVAGSPDVSLTEKSSYVIYIEYTPTKAQIDAAKKDNDENTQIKGYDGKNPIKGYLQQNPNKKLNTGLFSGKFGIDFLGTELITPKDVNKSFFIQTEGYFSVVQEKKNATPYSEKNAKDLITKLKSSNIGITVAKSELVSREELGKANSPQSIVITKYLEKMFPGNLQAKIKDFKDYLIKFVIETGFDDNTTIKFLQEYLQNNTMTRTGFIALNNLYAEDIILDKDFISSDISPLLKSNLLVETPTDESESIIKTYREMLYTYETLNPAEVKSLSDRKGLPIELDKNGSVKRDSRRNLADAVVFKAGSVGKEIETLKEITNNVNRIKTDSKQPTQPVSPTAVPTTIKPEDEAKYNQMLKDFNLEKGDIPSLMAYLKSKNLIG